MKKGYKRVINWEVWWPRVLTMKSNGLTYAEIGDALGVSRQRVYQMMKKYRDTKTVKDGRTYANRNR